MVQSIDEQLNTITQDVADTYTALGAKGATLPAKKGTSNLKATVDSLPKGGFPYTRCTLDDKGLLSIVPIKLDDNTFKGFKMIGSHALEYAGGTLFGDIKYLRFPDLETVSIAGLKNFLTDGSINALCIDDTSFPKLHTIYDKGCYYSHFYVDSENPFPSLSVVKEEGFCGVFKNAGVKEGITVRFPSLKSVERASFQSSFEGITSSNFSVSFDALENSSDSTEGSFSMAFYNSHVQNVDFPLLKGRATFQRTFEKSTIKYFSAPLLNSVRLERCFYESTLIEANFNGLVGCSSFSYTFYNCTKLIKADFPSLIEASSVYYTFYGCKALTEVNFPELKSIEITYAFQNCTSLTTFSIPKATVFKASSSAFYGCKSLPSISFPNVTQFRIDSSTFSGCTALTEIHFRADMQATVEALSGYASKWGATNATIYFDL